MLVAGQNVEVLRRNTEVRDSFFRTDGAIAVRDTINDCFDFEANPPTVTAPNIARPACAP